MAWTEFYMQPTGSNLNAGSTNADAASVTTTNGAWDTTTRVFTAASGTPFSGVVAGEWASIYLDAATATPFIAQVESVGGGGASITVSATVRIGTQPTTGASGRSCNVGGAWASFAITVLSESTTLVTPCRVNVKSATYANTTTNRVVGWTGTTTFPMSVRGYNSSPGDLDNGVDSTRPEVTFTTAYMVLNSAFCTMQNINFSTSGSGVLFYFNGGNSVLSNCRFTNTRSNVSATCIATNLQRGVIRRCYLMSDSAASQVVNVTSGPLTIQESVVSGGIIGVSTSSATLVNGCLFTQNAGSAFVVTGAGANPVFFSGNTIYNCGGSGVEITVNSTSGVIIATDNVFSNCGGYAINNSSGVNTNRIFVANNLYYNNTSGNLNGLGDTIDLGSVTDSASPFVNAVGGDFTIASTSNGYGLSRKFENVATTSYADIGAVQHQNPAAGAGGARLVGASALVTPGGCY